MEAPVFLLFGLAIGYLLLWTAIRDKRDPDGGYDGWFAIKRPPGERSLGSEQRPRIGKR